MYEVAEVVVVVDLLVVVQRNVAEQLHADYGVYEEQHDDEQAHIRKSLLIESRVLSFCLSFNLFFSLTNHFQRTKFVFHTSLSKFVL